ncbi:hypothetical protein HAX54_020119 [Datura stramonium]|uniref:Uncharacterized protein n=1 Tax=Datura stramonium TaxID=4076 RepID=A0ABS8UR81_DATST|nr:hypothetical protein [Datura stramonium]
MCFHRGKDKEKRKREIGRFLPGFGLWVLLLPSPAVRGEIWWCATPVVVIFVFRRYSSEKTKKKRRMGRSPVVGWRWGRKEEGGEVTAPLSGGMRRLRGGTGCCSGEGKKGFPAGVEREVGLPGVMELLLFSSERKGKAWWLLLFGRLLVMLSEKMERRVFLRVVVVLLPVVVLVGNNGGREREGLTGGVSSGKTRAWWLDSGRLERKREGKREGCRS